MLARSAPADEDKIGGSPVQVLGEVVGADGGDVAELVRLGVPVLEDIEAGGVDLRAQNCHVHRQTC